MAVLIQGAVESGLLVKAARAGRIRGIGLSLWAQAVADRPRAGSTLRAGLRAARALHSGERRLVQDALYGLIRSELGLKHLLGEDPLASWLGWLVLAGLPPDVASPELPGPWAELAERWDTLGEGLDAPDRLALRHSMPRTITSRVVGSLGEEAAAAFFRASDERAPLTVRVNAARCTREALVERLAGEGIAAVPLPTPGALRLEGRANVEALASWRDGWFEVQDEGSQRVAALVPAAGRVLDVCAGAGGKSLALAARGASVLALDPRRSALDELTRRAARAGVRIGCRALRSDELPGGLDPADAVLVDAPCSGTGVLRRHPEHRWRVDEAELSRLQALQRQILRDAAEAVRPGGVLVYATCSVLADENEDVVSALPGWGIERAERTWPHEGGCDGFGVFVLHR